MKNVQQIRDRVMRTQHGALLGIRSYASMLDGSQEVVEKLRGDEGMQILADVTDFLMERLGHVNGTASTSPFSKTRRKAKAMTKRPRGTQRRKHKAANGKE